jgi:putative spermidine/putrescine transport system permease protein
MPAMTTTQQQLGTISAPARDVPLAQKLRRSERRRKLQALALVAPLFLFTLLVFAGPILLMLVRSVENPEVRAALPHAVPLIAAWDGQALPDDEVFAAMARDLAESYRNKTIADLGQRLNYEASGLRSLVTASARKLARSLPETPTRDTLIGLDPAWGKPETWRALRRAEPAYTPFYLLAALDLRRDDAGRIVPVTPEQAIYVDIFLRTLKIAAAVTGLCLLAGFPTAYLLANAPPRWAGIAMICVLLPFWTSLLVRTTAWVVLLQKNGIVNDQLMALGLVDAPLTLLFARPAVYLGLVHILLPFVILPLYSVMASIRPDYMRAAQSLGAHPVTAFLRVYLPLTLPGIAAGGLLAFILAVGYYITPALLGGPKDQMISYFIAYHANTTLNWGLASALGTILLVTTLILAALYQRLAGGARLG